MSSMSLAVSAGADRPPPWRLLSSSSPPCSRTAERADDSPRPTPPVSRLREDSRRKNGMNTWSSDASGIPGPRSLISITMLWALLLNCTSGSRAYFRAFSSRLVTARFNPRGRPLKTRLAGPSKATLIC
ncbi:hypothetical protein D9M71_548240 [compost metagenome]